MTNRAFLIRGTSDYYASVGDVPVELGPLVKDALVRHVAFARSLEVLRGMGVRVIFDPQAPQRSRMPGWPRVLEELHTVTRDDPGGRD